MSAREIDDTFDRFVTAFRTRGREELFATWTPDIRVWHSADRRVKDREEYLAFIRGLAPRTSRFVDVRREYFTNGFVQQNSVETTLADGRVETEEMCLVLRMVDGRISRIDEYSTYRGDPR